MLNKHFGQKKSHDLKLLVFATSYFI